MRIKIKTTLIMFLVLFVLAACGGESKDSIAIYTHNVEDEMQPMVSALEEATGVSVDFLNLSSEEGYSRAEAEFPDVGAEIHWGQFHSLALLAQEEGMLGTYQSPEWDDSPEE